MPFVSGDDTLTVPPGGCVYPLLITPQLGGTYTGSITFTAPTGEYVWYTLEVTVDSPLQDRSIDLSAVVRKVSVCVV